MIGEYKEDIRIWRAVEQKQASANIIQVEYLHWCLRSPLG